MLRINLSEYEAGRILDDLERQGIPRAFFEKAARLFLENYDPHTGNLRGPLAARNRYRDQLYRRGSEPVLDCRTGVSRVSARTY